MVDDQVNLPSEQVYCSNMFSHFLHYTFHSHSWLVAASFYNRTDTIQDDNQVWWKIRRLNGFSFEHLPYLLQDDLLKTSAYLVKKYSSSREIFDFELSKTSRSKNQNSRVQSDAKQGKGILKILRKRDLKSQVKAAENLDLDSAESCSSISENSSSSHISEESFQKFLNFVISS